MISMTVSGDNFEELHARLLSSAAFLAAKSPAPATQDTATVEAPKSKPGRKPKDAAPAAGPLQTDIEEVTSTPAATPTYEEVVNALKIYMTHPADAPRGMSGVIKFLKDNFGVEQTKALKPEDYARAIELAAKG